VKLSFTICLTTSAERHLLQGQLTSAAAVDSRNIQVLIVGLCMVEKMDLEGKSTFNLGDSYEI
jgi:hypothetical protein